MSEDYKSLFNNLLEELTNNGLSYAEISLKSGIKANKFSNIKRGRSSVTKSDWEKLNAAYGEGKKDPIEEIDKKLDKLENIERMQRLLMEQLLAQQEGNPEQQDHIRKMLSEDGDVEQAFSILAKRYNVSILEVKGIFYQEIERLQREEKKGKGH